MFKVVIKTFLKVMLALGVVFAALMLVQRFAQKKADYIEIYNDEEEGDLF